LEDGYVLFFALCSIVTLDEVSAIIKPFVSLYVASGQALSVLYRLLRAEVEATSMSLSLSLSRSRCLSPLISWLVLIGFVVVAAVV
jgi:flagellin-like protein